MNNTKTRDMTQGSIPAHLIGFAVPLIIGNMFQMLYNTVDSLVVGNYVGKEALAAVGSTTMIVNILVFFFNGFSYPVGWTTCFIIEVLYFYLKWLRPEKKRSLA